MKTICPNCKREDTMNYDATWGVCNACGWRGNPSAFGWTPEPVEEPPKRKKGERLHTMYEDENGNIVVGDDW